MILTITLNPSVDRAIYLKELRLGDTNRIVRTETDAGGKGINLSRVADELGAATLATGFIGDGPGAFVKSVLDQERVPHDFVEIEGDTRINFSVEDESESPPTTFNERGPEISPDEWERLIEKCRALAPKTRWACIGGSIPPGLGPEAYRDLVVLFKEAGSRVMLDADGEPMRLGVAVGPDLVKPNVKEAGRLLERDLGSDEECVSAARDIREMGIAMVLLSRGEDGAVLATDEGLWLGRSPQVEAISTIGSGDSMLGGFLWALQSKLSIEEAFSWALAAGAATATTGGSEIARQPVIERLLPLTSVERVR